MTYLSGTVTQTKMDQLEQKLLMVKDVQQCECGMTVCANSHLIDAHINRINSIIHTVDFAFEKPELLVDCLITLSGRMVLGTLVANIYDQVTHYTRLFNDTIFSMQLLGKVNSVVHSCYLG